jgi:ubiquinone/menaquinone biosynthesis C-methylase UbiE
MTDLGIRPAGTDTATPLNIAKRLRLIEKIAGPLEGKRIIDCGCGAGEYVRALSRLGGHAYGFEYQTEKLLANDSGSADDRLAGGDIQNIPFPDASFDLAIVNEVLEHVPDDLAGLREVHRILKPTGTLVVLSPNRLYPFETHGVYWKRSDRRLSHTVPFIPYIPIPVGRTFLRYWARNYWPWELRDLIRRANFNVESTHFVWQTFENVSGHQPTWITRLRPLLRGVANLMERLPLISKFGVSQVIRATPE